MRPLIFIGFCLLALFGKATDQTINHFAALPNAPEERYALLIHNIQQKNLGTNDTAFEEINKAIRFYRKKDQLCELKSAYAVKGRLFNNREQQDSSANNFIKAARIQATDCPDFDTYYLYLSWGRMEEQIGEFFIADSLQMIAFRAAENLDDIVYLLNVKANLANIYSKVDREIRAIREVKSIMRIAEENNVESHKYYSRQNLGAYYVDLEYYDSAVYILEELQTMLDQDQWPYLAMDMHNNLAVSYENLGQPDLADFHYQQAIHIASSNNSFYNQLIFLDNYSVFKRKEGDFEMALKLINRYIDINDSLYNVEKIQTIKLLETQYEVAKQREALLQSKLEIEKNIRNRNTLLFFLLGTGLILIGVYSRLTYINRSRKIIKKEKDRSDELLLNILPEEVAEELKEKGESEARNFDEVTVIFTDFIRFTETAENLSAKELVDEINACFRAFDAIIQKYHIEKIKTIGDAYMAAGGLNVPKISTPSDAVKASLEMQEFMTQRKATRDAQKLPAFEMRVGIHSGPVVAGIVGVKKFQYDIWGDTVNTASRMESASEPGKVNISQATYELLKDHKEFRFEARGKISAKGKGEMNMWFVK